MNLDKMKHSVPCDTHTHTHTHTYTLSLFKGVTKRSLLNEGWCHGLILPMFRGGVLWESLMEIVLKIL